MSDPRALVDAYSRDGDWSREAFAPKAFAALRSVLDRCEWMDAMIAEYKPYELAAFVRQAIVKALEEK
ncbi:hypothetical protein [Amycolatopsis pigmentata]|uniref:Uncharacterized protein n=1 Tax=Amycolatopsis pigmentata TaxID=450801 RepID=A0ABW5G637_9PSEU